MGKREILAGEGLGSLKSFQCGNHECNGIGTAFKGQFAETSGSFSSSTSHSCILYMLLL